MRVSWNTRVSGTRKHYVRHVHTCSGASLYVTRTHVLVIAARYCVRKPNKNNQYLYTVVWRRRVGVWTFRIHAERRGTKTDTIWYSCHKAQSRTNWFLMLSKLPSSTVLYHRFSHPFRIASSFCFVQFPLYQSNSLSRSFVGVSDDVNNNNNNDDNTYCYCYNILL